MGSKNITTSCHFSTSLKEEVAVTWSEMKFSQLHEAQSMLHAKVQIKDQLAFQPK